MIATQDHLQGAQVPQISLVVTQRELDHSIHDPSQRQIAMRSPSADIQKALTGLSLKNRLHITLGGFLTLDVADPGAIWLAHNAKHADAFQALFDFLATRPDREIRLLCEIAHLAE
jgi:hypothetical protein